MARSDWDVSADTAVKLEFKFDIDEIYSIKRNGESVVAIAGRVISGKVEVGDCVIIPHVSCECSTTEVIAIQMFKDGIKELDIAFPGDMIGLVFKGLEKRDVKPGGTIIMRETLDRPR